MIPVIIAAAVGTGVYALIGKFMAPKVTIPIGVAPPPDPQLAASAPAPVAQAPQAAPLSAQIPPLSNALPDPVPAAVAPVPAPVTGPAQDNNLSFDPATGLNKDTGLSGTTTDTTLLNQAQNLIDSLNPFGN